MSENVRALPEILTLNETVSYLQLSRNTILKLDIPKYKLGSSFRYKKTELIDWLERQVVEGGK